MMECILILLVQLDCPLLLLVYQYSKLIVKVTNIAIGSGARRSGAQEHATLDEYNISGAEGNIVK